MKIIVILILGSLSIGSIYAQMNDDKVAILSTDNWLKDQTTIPFSSRTGKSSFSGIRLTFEPQWGWLIQNDENRIQNEILLNMSKFGLETNLYKGWLSLQTNFIFPTKVELDSKSEIVVNNYLKDSESKIGMDLGFTVGLSLIDGVIAVGAGWVYLTNVIL